MTLQNRVDPWGALVADPARGTLMGNRGGRIHDAAQRLGKRRWATPRWIACEMSFKGRQRKVWGDSYTELFFLDEVTALAAGHRPCFECRRGEAKTFVAGRALADVDAQLHAERTGEKPEVLLSAVPDGAMVEIAGAAFARRDNRLLRWSFAGYTAPEAVNPDFRVKLLTPPTITAILRNGYQPRWHQSAQQWDD